MKKIMWFVLALAFLLAGCSRSTDTASDKKGGYFMQQFDFSKETIDALPQLQPPKKGEKVAVLHTTKGDITLRLFPELAPKAVENFTKHIEDGYYNGVIFHRVIPQFMIQGGDPQGTGMGGESIWGKGFETEANENLIHIRGALSMANTGMPNSNGSQFFIVQNSDIGENYKKAFDDAVKAGKYPAAQAEAYKTLGGTPHLDGKHPVFGQVLRGMDVVDAIANVKVGQNDRPVEDVVIQSAEMTEWNE